MGIGRIARQFLAILRAMEAPINTYPGSQPTPVPPAPAPKAPMSKQAMALVAVVVIILAVVAAVFLNPGIRAWFSSLFGVSLENRSVLVRGMTEDGMAALYEIKGEEVVPVSPPEDLESASSRAGVTAGVSGTDLVIMRGNKRDVLFSDPEHKGSVAVSPDGSAVAYASMIPGSVEEGVARWYVKQVDVTSRQVSILGIGYAPQYVLRDGKTYVFYTTPDGITLVDVSTGEELKNPVMVEGPERYAAIASDDGAYLSIRDALVGQYSVYRVDGTKADHLSFSALRQLPKEVVSTVFRAGKLYTVSTTEAGQEILVYASPDAAEPSLHIALPPSSAPYELLP